MLSRLWRWVKLFFESIPSFDIMPPRRRHVFTPSSYKNVEEALRSDWEAIGRDLNKVTHRADLKDLRIKEK